MLWSDVSQWGKRLGYDAYALHLAPPLGTTRHYHCLRETLKVTVYHAHPKIMTAVLIRPALT